MLEIAVLGIFPHFTDDPASAFFRARLPDAFRGTERRNISSDDSRRLFVKGRIKLTVADGGKRGELFIRNLGKFARRSALLRRATGKRRAAPHIDRAHDFAAEQYGANRLEQTVRAESGKGALFPDGFCVAQVLATDAERVSALCTFCRIAESVRVNFIPIGKLQRCMIQNAGQIGDGNADLPPRRHRVQKVGKRRHSDTSAYQYTIKQTHFQPLCTFFQEKISFG